MSEMNQFEYTLDDDEEKKYGVSNKFPTKAKIIITILIIIQYLFELFPQLLISFFCLDFFQAIPISIKNNNDLL